MRHRFCGTLLASFGLDIQKTRIAFSVSVKWRLQNAVYLLMRLKSDGHDATGWRICAGKRSSPAQFRLAGSISGYAKPKWISQYLWNLICKGINWRIGWHMYIRCHKFHSIFHLARRNVSSDRKHVRFKTSPPKFETNKSEWFSST